MSPFINIMLNDCLQLLKLFLLMSLNIQHLKFIFSFLLMNLLFKRLNLLLHCLIFLFNLFAISLLVASFLATSFFVIAFDRWTIFLAALCLALFGRSIIRAQSVCGHPCRTPLFFKIFDLFSMLFKLCFKLLDAL